MVAVEGDVTRQQDLHTKVPAGLLWRMKILPMYYVGQRRKADVLLIGCSRACLGIMIIGTIHLLIGCSTSAGAIHARTHKALTGRHRFTHIHIIASTGYGPFTLHRAIKAPGSTTGRQSRNSKLQLKNSQQGFKISHKTSRTSQKQNTVQGCTT